MKIIEYLKAIWKVKRVLISIRRYNKAHKRLIKEKALRIFIENNPNVNLFNYPYYRLRWKKYTQTRNK